MLEVPILQLPGVSVSTTKVVIGGTTYFLPNVTSVRMEENESVRNFGIILAVASVIVLIVGGQYASIPGIVFGICGMLGAAAAIYNGIQWELVLTTGAAEQQVLKSPKKEVIVQVLSAINSAVEQRHAAAR